MGMGDELNSGHSPFETKVSQRSNRKTQQKSKSIKEKEHRDNSFLAGLETPGEVTHTHRPTQAFSQRRLHLPLCFEGSSTRLARFGFFLARLLITSRVGVGIGIFGPATPLFNVRLRPSFHVSFLLLASCNLYR